MKIVFGGGLNEQQQPSIHEAALGSYNFDLSKDSNKLIPRAPFDLKGTSTNAGDIRGFLQLVKRDNTETTLVQSGNTVYLWDGSSTFTSKGSCNANSQLRDCYWSLNDYLVITDLQKLTTVQKWDGTTLSTITTGLASDLYAKYAIVHNGRVWLFNVTTSTDTPHLMVASGYENPTSYSTSLRGGPTTDGGGSFSTGLEAFYMLSPDLRPINGVAKTIAGDLIISTEGGGLFKLSGTSAATYKWSDFYPQSNAIGDESLTSMGNDLVYMRKGGNIDALRSTDTYGDMSADDLSRWIPTTVKNLTDSITIYDQTNQKVLFFVDGKVLVLFKDILYAGAPVDNGREKLSPWSVYKTLYTSNYGTSAAKYMKQPGTQDYSVFFGDSSGHIFDFNGTGSSGDAGSASIQTVRKTRLVDSNIRHVTRGSVEYRRLNEVPFNITVDWADEYNESTASMTLKGPPAGSAVVVFGGTVYFGGSYYFSQGFEFAEKVSHMMFSNVGRGPAAFITFSSETTKNFQVDSVDFQ